MCFSEQATPNTKHKYIIGQKENRKNHLTLSKGPKGTVARLIVPLMRNFEAQCEREEGQETAEVVKNMILLRAEEAVDFVLARRERGWSKRPASEPARKALGRLGTAQDEATSPAPSRKKAPSFAEMMKRVVLKLADAQGAAVRAKSCSCERPEQAFLTASGLPGQQNPGTDVVQAVNTDAYLIGPIERHLNRKGAMVKERRAVWETQQKLTCEKKKACPKAVGPGAAPDQMVCMEVQTQLQKGMAVEAQAAAIQDKGSPPQATGGKRKTTEPVILIDEGESCNNLQIMCSLGSALA
ncbi:hypothetical protein CFIMG_007552RA00001 [Ceratocystis fimbriata CBS 114723]|uniref:Uncharacterized protein n=1 Tax=Ceratocystis fimbriata CBS 114723 TaxID=1035309 RepID=A0A2C5WWA5_9PEZI|nr:hypothetical protein CFIMG_007552RA00001 [Ceratocystis fimbriata CBS 114723]